jgi:hypothetical protein
MAAAFPHYCPHWFVWRIEMRNPRLTITLAATAVAVLSALAPLPAPAQQPKSAPPAQRPPQAAPPAAAPQPSDQQPALAPPAAYKPVAVQLPKPMADPSFDAFRKQITTIAQKKDRAGLARLVAQNFFWIPEDKDAADKRKPGIDNLAKAIGLDGRDAVGWDQLANYAADPTAEPNADRPGVVCGPAEPTFDENAAEELIRSTQTDPAEWGYPSRDGLEVRSAPGATGPVTEKLGLYLVRAYPDDSPANAVQADFLRIVTPSGKLGFIMADALIPLANDQLCYVKEGNGWKIAGVIGRSPP